MSNFFIIITISIICVFLNCFYVVSCEDTDKTRDSYLSYLDDTEKPKEGNEKPQEVRSGLMRTSIDSMDRSNNDKLFNGYNNYNRTNRGRRPRSANYETVNRSQNFIRQNVSGRPMNRVDNSTRINRNMSFYGNLNRNATYTRRRQQGMFLNTTVPIPEVSYISPHQVYGGHNPGQRKNNTINASINRTNTYSHNRWNRFRRSFDSTNMQHQKQSEDIKKNLEGKSNSDMYWKKINENLVNTGGYKDVIRKPVMKNNYAHLKMDNHPNDRGNMFKSMKTNEVGEYVKLNDNKMSKDNNGETEKDFDFTDDLEELIEMSSEERKKLIELLESFSNLTEEEKKMIEDEEKHLKKRKEEEEEERNGVSAINTMKEDGIMEEKILEEERKEEESSVMEEKKLDIGFGSVTEEMTIKEEGITEERIQEEENNVTMRTETEERKIIEEEEQYNNKENDVTTSTTIKEEPEISEKDHKEEDEEEASSVTIPSRIFLKSSTETQPRTIGGMHIHRVLSREELLNVNNARPVLGTSTNNTVTSILPHDAPVLIQVPPRQVTCPPSRRMARGRCRLIW